MSHPQHSDPDERLPGSTGEGDIDDDRQDPPIPPKTGDDEDLDGFTPTPGDNGDDD